MERFLDAIHEEGAEIARSLNSRGIKLVDGSEIEADSLDYFFDNKADMEHEFYSELMSKVGQNKADWFCEVIANDWYDGKGARNGPGVQSLKLSVKRYLECILSGRDITSIVINDAVNSSASLFLDERDIAGILTINDQMMVSHIEAWKAHHRNSPWISNDDIFLRRGLSLDNPLDESIPYREWDYINSYSIAFSAPEKFSQMQTGKIPALINGDLDLFKGRILFFSPFVPNMKVGQLEAGVIPGERPEKIQGQGAHAGIREYILGQRPEPVDVDE
jgi:hypothetical protein